MKFYTDIPAKDKQKSEQVTYPYQEPLRKILDSFWICFFIVIPGLIDVGNSYWTPEEFFYPCNYANMISIDNTLEIQSQFNKTQNNIRSYNSLLSSSSDVINSEKYKVLLQDATEQSAALMKEFDYHKHQWKNCFNQNLIKFDNKVVGYQLGIVISGFTIALFQTIKCFQYISKIKNLDLTKKQKEAYAKDWKSISAFKLKLIFKCIILGCIASCVVLFSIRFFYAYPRLVEMPFFS